MAQLSVDGALKRVRELSRSGELRRVSALVNRTVCAPMVRDAVLDNFMRGGLPRFAPNTDCTTFMKVMHGMGGTPPLWGHNRFFDKVIANPLLCGDAERAWIEPRNPGPMERYIEALHEGVDRWQDKTPRMRRFFMAMAIRAGEMGYESVKKIFMAAAMSRKPKVHIKMAARRFYDLTPVQQRWVQAAWEEAMVEYVLTGQVPQGGEAHGRA